MSQIFYQGIFLYYQQKKLKGIHKNESLPVLWNYVYGIMLSELLETSFVINSIHSGSIEYLICTVFPVVYTFSAILLKYYLCDANITIDLIIQISKFLYSLSIYTEIKAHISWSYYKRLGPCYSYLKGYIISENLKALRNLCYFHNVIIYVYYYKNKPKIISLISVFLVLTEFLSHIFDKKIPKKVSYISISLWICEILNICRMIKVTYDIYNQ
ncbi:hypothetical protein CWI39_0945p0020 [Hamiltosporidium magnivora]|nr:hypothetical protein CWI39_0945p0020 [Hamiltosporidium magnivora]TBU07456.1 hypothetical protein CWI36_0271p0030 [Hamiltosporidium magnivora]